MKMKIFRENRHKYVIIYNMVMYIITIYIINIMNNIMIYNNNVCNV